MNINDMQVYIGSPLRIKEFRDLALCESVASIVSKLGFIPYIPHKDTGDPEKKIDEDALYRKNIQALNDSAFAIFEVTHPSHGVGMEIQYAILNNIPFLCIAEKDSVISKMIRGSVGLSNIEYYSDSSELRGKLEQRIHKDIRLRYLHKGRLITIEGIDFTGKTSICQRIVLKLKEQNKDVTLVIDPPSLHPWQEWKQFFETQQRIGRLSEAFLLLAARLDNYERVIKPALEGGGIVISDRYLDSWLAYQTHRLKSYFNDSIERTLDFLVEANNLFLHYSFLPLPDATILIVDEPEETLKRAAVRGAISKYEEIETQSVVQGVYLVLAKKYNSRFTVIDAKGKDVDAVFGEVYDVCNILLE